MNVKEEDKPTRQQLLWFLSLAKPEILLISLGMITLFISTLMNLCLPHYSGVLVDTVTKLVTEEGQAQLTKLLGYMGLVIAVTGVSTFIRNYCMTVAGERIVTRLNKQLFAHVLRQEIEFFDRTSSGELLNRLASDTVCIVIIV
jgi:ABC-type multidrug transport system fused ATPase/permease subunit